MTNPPPLLFDLDGTLIDSVYQHVIAWREALGEAGVECVGVEAAPADRDERRAVRRRLTRELRGDGLEPDPQVIARLPDLHAQAYARHFGSVRALPGARALLARLTEVGAPWRSPPAASR